VLHYIAGQWLTTDDDITPAYFWSTIYPAIQLIGKEQKCCALIWFFQAAITVQIGGVIGQDPSSIEMARPHSPARNQVLINHQLSLLRHHFPQLDPDAPTQANVAVATSIASFAQQQQAQYEEAKAERDNAKKTTVKKWLGDGPLKRLLRLTREPNELQLISHCPVYKDMAEVPKAQRLGQL
jgi:hypothetical protein